MAYDDILNTVGFIFFTVACLAWAPGEGLHNPAVVPIVYHCSKDDHRCWFRYGVFDVRIISSKASFIASAYSHVLLILFLSTIPWKIHSDMMASS